MHESSNTFQKEIVLKTLDLERVKEKFKP